MHRTLLIESGAHGLLYVNGQFCGPLEEEGQAFPAGENAEIYIQLFPFGEGMPLTAALMLRGGRIEKLLPQRSCYALAWPDGIIQLELRMQAVSAREEAEHARRTAASGVLLRYLLLRLAGDGRAQQLLMRPQDAGALPRLDEYSTAVPLRFSPASADERYDERAGLVRRTEDNIACVDAALAITSPAGTGRRLIERVEILRT